MAPKAPRGMDLLGRFRFCTLLAPKKMPRKHGLRRAVCVRNSSLMHIRERERERDIQKKSDGRSEIPIVIEVGQEVVDKVLCRQSGNVAVRAQPHLPSVMYMLWLGKGADLLRGFNR